MKQYERVHADLHRHYVGSLISFASVRWTLLDGGFDVAFS